jgi:hypothetical protein
VEREPRAISAVLHILLRVIEAHLRPLISNPETVETMLEARRGGLPSFDSVQDLMGTGAWILAVPIRSFCRNHELNHDRTLAKQRQEATLRLAGAGLDRAPTGGVLAGHSRGCRLPGQATEFCLSPAWPVAG